MAFKKSLSYHTRSVTRVKHTVATSHTQRNQTKTYGNLAILFCEKVTLSVSSRKQTSSYGTFAGSRLSISLSIGGTWSLPFLLLDEIWCSCLLLGGVLSLPVALLVSTCSSTLFGREIFSSPSRTHDGLRASPSTSEDGYWRSS